MPPEPAPSAASIAAEYEFGPFRLDAARRGYRFTAAVRTVRDGAGEPLPAACAPAASATRITDRRAGLRA